jgi:hypothetical protein
MQVVISTPFTGKTPHGNGFKGQDWFDFRAHLYVNFCVKNLAKQTDKDFLVWLQFRTQEKTNETTHKIESALKDAGLKYVITYNGPIMMEDRATWHNDDLIERSVKSLAVLGEHITDEWVCEINLDSDDMVASDFVETIKKYPPKDRGAFYMQQGYVYSIEDRLATWHNPTSMSIYAIVYPTKIFLDAKEHFEYQKGFNSHEQIPDKFDAQLLPDGMYCALVHGNNISTTWGHQFMGKEFYFEKEKRQILNKFI